MAKKKAAAKKKASKKAPKKRPVSKGQDDLEAALVKLHALLEQPKTEKKVLKLLLALSESQRRELYPVCHKWLRKVKKNEWIENSPGSYSRNPLMSAAMTAVFCTSSFTEIKKLGRWGVPSDDEVVLQVLNVRKPSWVEQFVELQLGRSYFWNSWRLCRELVRRGQCAKPDNPRYYTGMITGVVRRRSRGETNALRELRKDPGLLKDEIWRLFEYEGEGDNTLANVDRWEKSNWSGALVTLSKEGKLPRAKLLDSAIDALELGFNHYRARWFFEFFDRMVPTDRELKQRATRILDLIGSPTPNVAQWAFEKQQRLLDNGLIKDTSQVITACAPLLGGRHKKTVMQVLRLFTQLSKESPKLAREICLTSAEALSHEKADVQKAAFKLIEKHGTVDDHELTETVEKYASVAGATVKKQLNAWLKSGKTADTAKSPAKKSRPKKTAQKKTPLKKKAKSQSRVQASDLKKFDERQVELLCLEQLAAAFPKPPSPTPPIPAAVFNGSDFPRLDPERRLTPIDGLEELLEILGRVIEDDNLIDDAERAIDGLARLHTKKPDDFDKLIGPLHKRADKLLQRNLAAFAAQGVAGDICGLILAWRRGEPVTTKVTTNRSGNRRMFVHGLVDEPIEYWDQDSVPLAFMSRRMLDICGIVTSGQPQQLLSSPTHEGGWIDPATLVQRINDLKGDPPETDVVLAMLRLAPDGRAAALKKLKPKLKGEWINAVKHGLGAGGIRIGKSAALWAAAARCRSPLEDDPKVAKAFPKLGPGAGKVARFETRFWQKKMSYGPARYFDISTTEKLPKKVPGTIPSQLMQLNRDDETTLSFHDIGTTAGSIRWLATMWPSAFESFFAAGAQCIGGNLDWWEAAWHNRCFLEPLLDSDTPLLDMGEVLLLCGLAAKEPGEHGLAVDIAIQAINDGRLGTDNLGRMLTTGITSGHFNLPRLAKRLQDIANVSGLHAYVVMYSAETALPNVDAKQLPRGLGDVFELIAEIGAQIERGVETPECRSLLEKITGSNKTAKAAKQLLSIETSFDPQETIASAVANRFDRLKEWAKRK